MTTTFPTDNRNILDECDSTGGWTATDGPTLFTSDPAPVESTGYLGMQVSNTNENAYTAITSDDYSQGGSLSIWMQERASLDTTANVGFGIVLGDGTDRVAFAAGSDTVTGFRHETGPVKWACFILDPANLPTDTVTLAGVEANLTLTAITQVGVYFATTVKSVGGTENCFWDIIRWADPGDDVVMQGGATSGAAGNASEAAAVDRSIGNQQGYGVIRELATGVAGIQGNLTIGNAASSSDQYWTETNGTYAWEDRNLSDRNYYRFKLIGSSTATNCEFSFTAQTFTVPDAANAEFDANGADITVCNMLGCTFIGFDVGIIASDDTGDDWQNCAYVGNGSIQVKGCDHSGSSISGTVACALVESQDETSYDDTATEGSFTAGSGYAVSDTITLSNGALITVDAVSGGAVTQFTVTDSQGYPAGIGKTLTQSSTSGTGTGFELWPRSANLAEGGSLYYDLAVDPDGELDDLSITKGTVATHAVVFGKNVPANMTLRNCDFSGYNALDSQADSTFHFLDTTGSITLTLIGCTGNFSVKTEGVTVDVVTGAVTATVTAVTSDGDPIQSARVHLRAADGTALPYGDAVTITRSGTTATVTHTAHDLKSNDKVYLRGITDKTTDNGVKQITVTTANAYTFTTTDAGSTSYTGDGFIINGQDETSYDNSPTTEGTFSGGTGHAVNDVITLRGGAEITVDAVSSGVVTQFTVSSGDSVGGRSAGNVQDQISTTGTGSGFSLTLDTDNIVTEIRSTYVALDGDTDVNGEISVTRVFSTDQPVAGWSRKSTTSPYFQQGPINDTISSTTGLDLTTVMVSDE